MDGSGRVCTHMRYERAADAWGARSLPPSLSLSLPPSSLPHSIPPSIPPGGVASHASSWVSRMCCVAVRDSRGFAVQLYAEQDSVLHTHICALLCSCLRRISPATPPPPPPPTGLALLASGGPAEGAGGSACEGEGKAVESGRKLRPRRSSELAVQSPAAKSPGTRRRTSPGR